MHQRVTSANVRERGGGAVGAFKGQRWRVAYRAHGYDRRGDLGQRQFRAVLAFQLLRFDLEYDGR